MIYSGLHFYVNFPSAKFGERFYVEGTARRFELLNTITILTFF